MTHGRPTAGLSSAVVELSNDNRGFRVQTPTDDLGVATFTGLHEDYYELSVTSVSHKPQSSFIFVTAGKEQFKVTLEKIAVNLSWVQSDDLKSRDGVALQADISTDAPAPVIIVTPLTLDLNAIEQGNINNINMRLENRGGVTAYNVTIQLPEDHPFLRFEVDSTQVGDIPVNGTVMVLVTVRFLTTNPDVNVTMAAETETFRQRTISDIPHLLLKVLYNGACGTNLPKEVHVIMMRGGKPNATSEAGPPSDVELPDLDYNIPLEQSVFCEPCLLTVSECTRSIKIPREWAKCAAGTFRTMMDERTLYGTFLGGFIAMLELFVSCGQVPGYSRALNTNSSDSNVSRRTCVDDLKNSCEEKYSFPGEESSGNSGRGRAPSVAESRLVVQAIYNIRDALLPSSWDTFVDPVWFTQTAKPILGNSSASSLPLSELTGQLATHLPRSLEPEQAEEFFSKLRHFSPSTMSNLLGPFMKGLDLMTERGHSDPLTWYNEELKSFSQSPKDKHLCAKAKLRLNQKRTDVNSHVIVTMDTENGELTSLLDVLVNISIVRLNDSEDSSHLFTIELYSTPGFETENTGLALPLGASGSHQWRITPLDMAATEERVKYKISAVIHHTFRGKQLEVLIRGDILTVLASPHLQIHIFYPRFSPDEQLRQENGTDVPLSLKMVIMNNGTGAVNGLKVEAAKLSLRSWSTGKGIRCLIHDVVTDGEIQSKTFELHLGTIAASRTVLVQWVLLCPEAAVFDNLTLSFVQLNSKDESILSTHEMVMYHEVFHEVRVHVPAYDDEEVDPLVSFNRQESQRPDTVFRTDTGFTTADVFTTDNIDVYEILSDDGKTELQILVEDTKEGWYWLEIPFDFPDNQELKVCRRQDAKKLLIEHNVWLGKGQDGDKAIYIFDWFSLYDWGVRRKREATAFNSYFIELGVANTPPVFPKKKYETSVLENTDFLTIFYNCTATDADNAVTYYDLESAEGDAVPFSVTDSGDILVFGVIDRELTDVYRLNIFAFDNGNPVRSASTQLGINVLDENDNVAVFTEPRYSALVRANISLGAEFLRVKANDRDFGENGRVLYFIGGANSHPFDIDSHTGGISTSGFLTEQRYSFPVSAKNPNSSTISSAEVIISVIREEELAAIFETDIVTAEIREGQPIGSLVINVLSDIAVLTGDITFEILSDVPFSFNKFTGNIYTRAVLDREARDLYNFTLRALDDTPSGNQVAPPEEVIVLVNVSDINDNPPSFAFPEIKLQVSEDTAVGKIFYTITAKDPDLLTNGDVVRYELLNSTEDGCPFGLNQTQDGAQLYLVKPLDRENLARYYLTVKATDGGLPPQTGSAMLCITVGDTNDNPPWFETQSSTVNISKLLPVNSVVFTAHAVDNDLEAVLHYDIIDPSRRFRINSDTGILTLKISLKNADDLEFSVVIVVSDGLMESNMTLVISVSQKNFSPPAFKPDVYTVEVKETVPPGTFVEIVFADDDEGDWITYYIEEGNVDGMFHIDSVTGEIMTRYHLDVQLNANFTLKIVAKDDHDDDMTSMTGRATVYITVLPVNQHAPSFTEGEIIHASILEDAAKGTVVQLPDAYDEDGDNIQYSLLGSSDLFSVNPHDSDLHLLEVIDRETTPTVALTLVASDNGNPPKSSHTSVVIDVLDVNDNPPILQHLDDIIKVTQSAIRLKIPVHKVIAIDPDSGNNAALTYSLTMDTPLLRIDDSGAIYCKAECLTLNASITLPIVINVQDKGHPPQGTSNTTTLHVIVSPGTSDVNVTEEDAYSLEPSPSVAFQRALSGHIPFSEETPMHRFTAAELDFTEVISSFATPMEELTQTAVSPTASLPLLFQTTSAIMDQPTAMPSESTSTQLTSTRALPTAALPLSSYKEICQRPIDAVIRDTAGVFFFQDNYIYRVFEGRRLVVRGYPKSIRRIFSGWRKQKISGPINAAVHSEASGYTYLFKEAKIWVFLMSRLVEIAELESPVDLVLDAAIDLPGVGILLIKGSDVYRLTDEEKFTLSGPEPLESLLPGAPLPLDGAFVSTDQKTIHLFSGDLAYDWNVEDKTLSEESPIHITEWMDCEL